MTTEILAHIAFNRCPCREADDNPIDAYKWGRLSRDMRAAFLSCPYEANTVSWAEWRRGWNTRDIELDAPEFSRVPR